MIDRACISLSNSCNLKCKYCHFSDKQNSITSFDFNDIVLILDNIHHYCVKNNLNTFKLGIVGAGEPLIKKQLLFNAIKYVSDNNYTEIKMYTITNGTLIGKDDLEVFYQYRDIIRLCFSLDGYKELHNAGRAEFDKVMRAVRLYKEIFKEAPHINATANLLSYNNKEKLVKFFKEEKLSNVTFSILVGYPYKDLYITSEQFSELMEYIKMSGISSRQFENKKAYDCTMYGNLCGVGRTNIFITPEGVYPCGRFYKNDKYILGEYNASLFEIEKRVNSIVPVENGKCYYCERVNK
ncbi:MAG: radical SAM protein [Clostridia bacterium]|nr:radical SAM protein [Clostridia bacterium]